MEEGGGGGGGGGKRGGGVVGDGKEVSWGLRGWDTAHASADQWKLKPPRFVTTRFGSFSKNGSLEDDLGPTTSLVDTDVKAHNHLKQCWRCKNNKALRHSPLPYVSSQWALALAAKNTASSHTRSFSLSLSSPLLFILHVRALLGAGERSGCLGSTQLLP